MPIPRKPILAANWKMNKGPSETRDFLKSFLLKLKDQSYPCDIVVAPPFVSLAAAVETLTGANSSIQLAAQNGSQHDAGAYTGEVSMMMLKEFFLHYVILGHSERRAIYGESDEVINAKLKKAREAKLKPIFCIGETLAEREAGKLEEVLSRQVNVGLEGLTDKDMVDTVIAYEPVWAIGTGVTATTDQAQEAHAFVRSLVARKFSDPVAKKVRIQYGGSVKPSNAAELMACPDIDGALVGGASLDAGSFFELVKNACSAVEA
jgi:triosephosphate isomerase